jgi:hypothetical protein
MNTFEPINPALIDVMLPAHDGYPDDMAAQDTADVLVEMCGAASRDFPESLWIEPEYRADKARDNDHYHTWGLNYLDRFTNQNPTHECTTHMLRAEAEGCWNRQAGIIFPEGPKKGFRYEQSKKRSVWFSPLSIYAEANPRQWGGASCQQVLEIACKRGFLPEKIQPRDYGFKHDLQGTTGEGGMNQSRGSWVSVSNFPSGWQETAKHFKPLEVIVTTDWEKALCLLLHGRILGYGRSGHAIPPCIYNVASNAIGYADSYDVVRWDSLSTFKRACSSGVHCIESMTTPDDWSRPAGAEMRAGDYPEQRMDLSDYQNKLTRG